jgi:hypothetical protein
VPVELLGESEVLPASRDRGRHTLGRATTIHASEADVDSSPAACVATTRARDTCVGSASATAAYATEPAVPASGSDAALTTACTRLAAGTAGTPILTWPISTCRPVARALDRATASFRHQQTHH